ncbi:Collagen alpha-5(VI) chain, partial [Fusarium heterosporum]
MVRSLFFASIFAAGIYAQSTADPALTKDGAFQHVGCVAIRPGTFPRQFNLGQTGCASSCSSNGNIIGFRGNSCVCDRLDLSPSPITYRVVKVDNALCNQWCDPADKSKGTCGGASIRGWPIYDLYKRRNAQILYESFPNATPTPGTGPVQTLMPVPNPNPNP